MGDGDRTRPRQGHADGHTATEKAEEAKVNDVDEEDAGAERRSFHFLHHCLLLLLLSLWLFVHLRGPVVVLSGRRYPWLVLVTPERAFDVSFGGLCRVNGLRGTGAHYIPTTRTARVGLLCRCVFVS